MADPVSPSRGAEISIKFHNPEFLSQMPWLTYGRLRNVHVNGVLFGSVSTAFLGLVYYIVPRLCGEPMYKVAWGWWLMGLWNGFLVLGSITLLMGYSIGIENAVFEWPLNLLRYVVLVGVTVQVFGTILRRRQPKLYVSLWYTLAASIWILLTLLLGNVLL
ncbi:MAG: cbb3-type cytochrome c oxidase subunit I, partial [Nitrospirales bacterium]